MSKSKYQFSTPGLFRGVTAEEAANELIRIREKYGTLEPEYVVDESRDSDAVLHKCFQWDDRKAAELYRKRQAMALIENIKVVVSNERMDIVVRAFVNVSPAHGVPRSYHPTAEVIHSEEAYKDLLAQAKAEMESFITKYQQIEELNGVKAKMLEVLSQN